MSAPVFVTDSEDKAPPDMFVGPPEEKADVPAEMPSIDFDDPIESSSDKLLTQVDTAPQPPKSPYAFKLDDWSIRKGKEYLQEHVTVGSEAFVPPESFAADARGAFYECFPQLQEQCEFPGKHNFFKNLLEDPNYQRAHHHTQLNEDLTRLAYNKTVLSYKELVEKTKKIRAETPRDEHGKEIIDDSGLTSADKEMLEGICAAGSLAKEVAEEQRAISDASSFYGGNGPGSGPPLSPTQLNELVQKMKGNEQLKQIMANIGRYLRVASSKQRNKTTHGIDDLVGITLGNDIPRLLPSEMSNLMPNEETELLEWDMLRRLAEKTALCQERHTIEKVGKGPIVITVDTSGSMHGDKVISAKSLALALLYIARSQKRPCLMVDYSGGCPGIWLMIKPTEWPTKDIIEWAGHFYNGGTNLDVPINLLPTKWEEYINQGLIRKKTDVVFITDSHATISSKVEKDFLDWKAREEAKVTTLVVGGTNTKCFDKISDEVHMLNSITPDSAPVEGLLSV